MDRAMTGFDRDAEGDWFARLACGHTQHVRHRPPFTLRPWVETEEGRASKLGQALDCLLCDRLERPPSFVPYKRTPEFGAGSIPRGLLADHTTKAGVWASIVVLVGRLRYHVPSLGLTQDLDPSAPGTVAPEVPHRVEPIGDDVRFYVEFLRAPEGTG